MKTPSVTGKKAQVPYLEEPEIAALAFCRVSVSLLTRHWKIEALLLLWGNAGDPKQPTAEAKE